jgi:hypothetical protein
LEETLSRQSFFDCPKIIYIESEEFNDETEFITKTMWKEKQKP